MSTTIRLHNAVKGGDLSLLTTLLAADAELANARSENDTRGTFPLHVAAEFGQTAAAKLLLEHGADVSLKELENDAIALGWAAFFGRPGVVRILLEAGSDPSQRNQHGLTPLGCALGGTQGKWRQFSNAALEDWSRCVDVIRSYGGKE